ncbi:sugar phosphate isomerase/epimerase [Massilimaliae timonensis]|uniref:Sugar phosphate isomerase/epimerase n=1 Tax=Massiliimalia timonensis TaxID=1987501 RepID=A0A8J6PA35_9FIRM|nr:sugar phosphate isomerase/epimerase family protein [Massiliimalia timonensis]MBC8609773.1 sugar phosphate isomerase/epimerase [Massiliimalia timonensis]
MHLSIAVASKQAGDSAFVVWRGFEQAIQKAVEYGFDGVELALKSADEFKDEGLKEILRRYPVPVSCISTGQVFAASKLWFTHPQSEIREQTVRVFQSLIEIASEHGGIVNIGRARGFVGPGQTREEVEALFLQGLHIILPYAEKYEVKLVVEPVNRYETNFLNSVEEASAFSRKIGHPNLRVMPDVFHMNIEDDDICASFKRNADQVGYVHLADSNRYSPGRGHLDFAKILDTLEEIGYTGWCSLEILPEPTPDLAAKRGIEFLKPLFDAKKGAEK